jgi:hypothetical protein
MSSMIIPIRTFKPKGDKKNRDTKTPLEVFIPFNRSNRVRNLARDQVKLTSETAQETYPLNNALLLDQKARNHPSRVLKDFNVSSQAIFSKPCQISNHHPMDLLSITL